MARRGAYLGVVLLCLLRHDSRGKHQIIFASLHRFTYSFCRRITLPSALQHQARSELGVSLSGLKPLTFDLLRRPSSRRTSQLSIRLVFSQPLRTPSLLTTAHLAADVLLSCTTAFFLIKSKKNVLPQTVGLISALVRLTFQTAAPAAVWSVPLSFSSFPHSH
jgi:hypothetical protein